MESVNSFSTTKAGKAYVVNVYNLHPDGDVMVFQVDSGASSTLEMKNEKICKKLKKGVA